jgi:hypothetical protein
MARFGVWDVALGERFSTNNTRAVGLRGFMAAAIPGFRAAELQGWKASGLQGLYISIMILVVISMCMYGNSNDIKIDHSIR